ncbi:hypothetical protein [Nonomuraea insulae]|uniref:Uncharacterized protein n=1 Tax=Nonomuraea insulae TaxID=1616787 RepID=A0ABW1CKU1_9ACTN
MGILPPLLDAAKSETLDLPKQTLTEAEQQQLDQLPSDGDTT